MNNNYEAIVIMIKELRKAVTSKISQAPYDKTYEGTILKVLPSNTYLVLAAGKEYTITTTNNTYFKECQKINIHIPQNNWKKIRILEDINAGDTSASGVTSINGKSGNIIIGISDIDGLSDSLANNKTPTFTQATVRENISSGDTLSTLFGKIAKWFTDLKTVAFSGSYNDLSNKPTSLPADGGDSSTVSGFTVGVNVPADAKFTDTNTTYSEITTSEIDVGTSSTLRTITGRRIKYILDKVSTMISTAISALTKSDIGLGNVDNTGDLSKPISTATQTALNGKVNNNQVLTNVPSGAKFTDTVTTINDKTGAIAKADIVALGIPAQDTVYTHPSTHPASIIVESSAKRFVADTEKTTWNAVISKADKSYVDTELSKKVNTVDIPTKLSDFTKDINFDERYYTETEMAAILSNKVDNSRVLADVPINAKFTDTIYTHPSTHPASMITQTASYRFVSDTEKATWNGKSNFSGNYDDLSNKPTIPEGVVVNNTLTSTSTTQSLSANQGRVLKGLVDNAQTNTDNKLLLQSTEPTTQNQNSTWLQTI